jgi:hypothetical protein
VVENKGIEVSHDPIQGRIMVATRDFHQLNEAILREAPALICEQQDYLDFMEHIDDDPYWDCPHCGMLETSHMLKVEQILKHLLKAIETDVQQTIDKEEGGGVGLIDKRSRFSPKMLQEMVQRCQTLTSLTRHLTVKALRMWVNIATNYAYAQITRIGEELSVVFQG